MATRSGSSSESGTRAVGADQAAYGDALLVRLGLAGGAHRRPGHPGPAVAAASIASASVATSTVRDSRARAPRRSRAFWSASSAASTAETVSATGTGVFDPSVRRTTTVVVRGQVTRAHLDPYRVRP